MGTSKERRAFLKWRRERYPLLETRHEESYWLWQGWEARAELEAKKENHGTAKKKS